MPSAKVIKNRITSVKNTKKITNAMYLIASTKMRKAKLELDAARPYFDIAEREIKRIFETKSDVKSMYFYPETGRKPAERYAYLVITADKGLAGAYNHNIILAADEEMRRHKNVKLYVVGEYGRQHFKRHKIPIEKTFIYTAQNPTFRRAREIANLLLMEYRLGNVDEIRIIYSNLKSSVDSEVVVEKLLPFDRADFGGRPKAESRFNHDPLDKGEDYEFYPSAESVLDSIVPSYVAGYLYGALVDSFCSEQNARMAAMSSANDNAENLLGELSMEYNRVRQAAITQEITEVAAGAKAQKKKRQREAEIK